MKIELSITELAEISQTLKRNLSERENDAARAGMCLRQEFVDERKALIKKLDDALSEDRE